MFTKHGNFVLLGKVSQPEMLKTIKSGTDQTPQLILKIQTMPTLVVWCLLNFKDHIQEKTKQHLRH